MFVIEKRVQILFLTKKSGRAPFRVPKLPDENNGALSIVQLANRRKVRFLSFRFSMRRIQCFIELLTEIVSWLSFQY